MNHNLANRRGAALLLALIICAALTLMCLFASERMAGMKRISAIDLAKQKAGAAAEAVGAMVEAQLMNVAANYTALTVAVDTPTTSPIPPWWGLAGCVYKDSAGKLCGPGFTAGAKSLWLNGCVVRWSVEPVRVYNSAWSNTPASASQYVVNPPVDTLNLLTWQASAKNGPQGAVPGTLNPAVSDYYHFRVVAHAWALSDPANTTANPWNNPQDRVAGAQSQRVLQIHNLQLFNYALFYCADSPVGDLDLQTGGLIAITNGSVHSNGAIYIRGGEFTGFLGKNFHYFASGDSGVDTVSPGQNIFVGQAAAPVAIEGVAGIFRMSKTGNHMAAQYNMRFAGGVTFDPLNPFSVPTDASQIIDNKPPGRWQKGVVAQDLNGDQTDSQRHKINDVPFTRGNDSRSAVFSSAFNECARDSSNGAAKVTTLQNIAELGGRPFEAQSVVFTASSGSKCPLYGTPGLSQISRYPSAGLIPLYYTADPTAAATAVGRPRPYRTVVAANTLGGTRPILAEEMSLWWDPNFTTRDVVHPSEEVALYDQLPQFTAPITAANAGDGAAYTLGTAANVDRERPVSMPTLVNAAVFNPAFNGYNSFPGVPFVFKAAIGGVALNTLWNPQFFGCGFSPREVKGFYLEEALFGDLPTVGTSSKQQQYYTNGPNLIQDIAHTGIVIRERRWQQRPATAGLAALPFNEAATAWNYYWPGAWLPGATTYLNPNPPGGVATAVLPIPRPTWIGLPSPGDRLNYVQYLCSQYDVLFCGRNITAPFFCQILLPGAANPRDFIVTEDEFIDQRESGYLWGLYGANGNLTGTGGPTDDFYQYSFFPPQPPGQPSTVGLGLTASRDYRQNVLTIHMKAFQDWLRTTPMSELGYPPAVYPALSAEKAKDHFNGRLYCARTRRGDSYHPLFTPELDWPAQPYIANNIQTAPSRLSNQTHFRAYWFTDVATPSPAWLPPQTSNGITPIGYPPINFPWNWREPSGPLDTFRCATRLKGQTNDPVESVDAAYYRVYWNHPPAIPTPADTSGTSSTAPLGTSGFSFFTPQRFYLWGNFAYVVPALDSSNTNGGLADIVRDKNNIVPCGVFADNYTEQSVAWQDINSQTLPTGTAGYSAIPAANTSQFFAMVINNSPTDAWNCGSFGTGGQEGTFRTMENGLNTHFWWSGSQVVMNIGRYFHSGHGFAYGDRATGRISYPANMGVGSFVACTAHYVFNANLKTPNGRPPGSPGGPVATRVVNQLTFFGE